MIAYQKLYTIKQYIVSGTILNRFCLRYDSVKQNKMLRMREIKARFPYSENCSASLFSTE